MTTKKGIRVLVTLSSVFFLSSIAWAVDCPLPDTGQTKCYDKDSEITCPNPGQDFYGQDAQYICNPQSYTSLAGGIMVQDNVTGLIWEVKQDKDDTSNYTNPHDADNTYTWYDGSSGTPGDGTDTLDFIAALNSSQFGGYSDWRLPTIMELAFLVDRNSYNNPSINTTYFPNTQSSSYWSSTTRAGYPNDAWSIDFLSGYVSSDLKSHSYYVRAVRSGQCGSFDNFVDNGDGTVTNTDTGLMWELKTDDGGNRDEDSVYTWGKALSYCENLTLAGYDDWRLPNVNELHSIVDYSTYGPSINTTFFHNTVSSSYWSSTTTGNPYDAWFVDFLHGYVYGYDKSPAVGSARAVRSGQCGPYDSSTTTTISGSTTTTISGSTTTTVQSCPTEEIYGEHSEETEILRYLRDNILNQTPEGQELIKLYYEWSPVIVEMMNEDEDFRSQVKEMIDGVLELIGEAIDCISPSVAMLGAFIKMCGYYE